MAMSLDPSNSWAVTRCNYEYPHHRVAGVALWNRAVIEYSPELHDSGVRLPKRVIEDGGTTDERDAGEFGRFEIVLKDFRHEDVPDEAFTLAAFGLTEDGENTSRIEANWSRWWILLVNLGLILVAAGIWMIRRHLRRNLTTAPASRDLTGPGIP